MSESSGARERNINIRASSAEYKRIQRGAARHGMTLSEFLRVLGSSEQWAIDQKAALQEWQAMLTRLETTPTPPGTTRPQAARGQAALIASVLIVAARLEHTAAELQRLLSPAMDGLQALLQRVDDLAQEPAAAKGASWGDGRRHPWPAGGEEDAHPDSRGDPPHVGKTSAGDR